MSTKVTAPKVSKEGKKFKEYYEVGFTWLPKIVNGLYLIRDYRCRNIINTQEIQKMFDEEGYFISYNTNALYCENICVGKGNAMYINLNRDFPLIPFKPSPTHAVVKNVGADKNYVQYVQRSTPVFAKIKYESALVQLPEGLDIINLPDESMFQTELCIDNNLVQGAAAWMGLRDFGFILGEVVYYGDSLLKMKRLNAAVENVVMKLREKYKA